MEIPIKPQITLQDIINGRQLRILKDDGCSTNVISKVFAANHRDVFNIQTERATISHSDRDYVEESNETVIGAEIQIWNHR